MKKTNLKYIFLSFLLAFASACENYIGGDTNKDPNRVSDVSVSALLPSVLFFTSQAHFNVGYNTSMYVQQTASVFEQGVDSQINLNLDGAWTNIYLNVLSNTDIIIKKAETQNLPYYVGIGKVIMALNLGLATDQWGDIPFSEAFKGSQNFTPKYDSQESIYQNVVRLLNEALVELNKTSPTRPSADDIVYGGNIDRWKKLANALKARYAIHLTKKGNANAATQALQAINAGALAGIADDFQLIYNSRNLNPYHSGVALANATGNRTISWSAYLIDDMQGRTFGNFDPRLPLISIKRGNNPEYIGIKAGGGAPQTANYNVDFAATTWHSKADSPIEMMTFAEQKFIEAEAQLILNNREAAYQAYLAGINASMDKMGVSAAAKNEYLAHSSVAVGAANLSNAQIMREKYKANLLNPEVWNDMRRYDYSTTVFRNLSLPLNHNNALNGQWVRRIEYPQSEQSRNATQVAKVFKTLEQKLWWDN